MKCMTPKKVDDIAMKEIRKKRAGVVAYTSKWSLIVAVYILFNRFHWSQDKMREFLKKYAETSDEIVPFREEVINPDDRSKPYGMSFNEIHESNGLDIHKGNIIENMSEGKVDKRIGFYQDHIAQWILDVQIDTLQSVAGWYGEDRKKTCERYAQMYKQQIRKLKNEDEIIKMLRAIKEDYGFDLEIETK